MFQIARDGVGDLPSNQVREQQMDEAFLRWRQGHKQLGDVFSAAETFFVSLPIIETLLEALPTLDWDIEINADGKWLTHQEWFPDETGYIWLERALIYENGDRIRGWAWDDREPRNVIAHGAFLEAGLNGVSGEVRAPDEEYRFMWSLLTFMQQPYVAVEGHAPDRATRRRMEKAGISPHQAARMTNIVHLRRSAPVERVDHDGNDGREYHHRWLVRGHWRNQYHPSDGSHRPVFVRGHVKGPEGAPVLPPRSPLFLVDR